MEDRSLESFLGQYFLKVLCVVFFLGKAWGSIFWTSNTGSQAMGIYFFALAVLILFPLEKAKSLKIGLLLLASVLLGVSNLYKLAVSQITILQLFEDSIKILTPVILAQSVNQQSFSKGFVTLIKFSIALTFAAHGLYALGIFLPVPNNFIEMTVNILSVTPRGAYSFLFLAGTLDLVIVALVFVPKYAKYVLGYAAFWGFCTALARPMAQIGSQEVVQILHRWLFETLIRLPNAAIPLFLLISEHQLKTKKLKNKIEEYEMINGG